MNKYNTDIHEYIHNSQLCIGYQHMKEPFKLFYPMIIDFLANKFSYDYNELKSFLEIQKTEWNKTYPFTCNNCNKIQFNELKIPNDIEFLEIMEFMVFEYKRIIEGFETGKNFKDDHYLYNTDFHPGMSRIINYKEATRLLYETKIGIEKHKDYLGHNKEIKLTKIEKEAISFLLNLFFENGDFPIINHLPKIIYDFNLPKELRKNNNEKIIWNFDRTLGDYYYGYIRIYERAILEAAKDLNIPYYSLRLMTIIHELSHWIFDRLPDINTKKIIRIENDGSIKNNYSDETWVKTNLINHRSEELEEAWAQLLTYWVVEQIEYMNFFKLLNNSQSKIYKRFEEILSLSTSQRDIINSLPRLRQLNKELKLDDWKNMLKNASR